MEQPARRLWFVCTPLVLGIAALGYVMDEARAPRDTDAVVAFRMLFDDGGQNRVFLGDGTIHTIARYAGRPAVACKPLVNPASRIAPTTTCAWRPSPTTAAAAPFPPHRRTGVRPQELSIPASGR